MLSFALLSLVPALAAASPIPQAAPAAPATFDLAAVCPEISQPFMLEASYVDGSAVDSDTLPHNPQDLYFHFGTDYLLSAKQVSDTAVPQTFNWTDGNTLTTEAQTTNAYSDAQQCFRSNPASADGPEVSRSLTFASDPAIRGNYGLTKATDGSCVLTVQDSCLGFNVCEYDMGPNTAKWPLIGYKKDVNTPNYYGGNTTNCVPIVIKLQNQPVSFDKEPGAAAEPAGAASPPTFASEEALAASV